MSRRVMPGDCSAITLRPFRPEDQAPVKELILSGLEGHWGTRDPAKNRDLDDIAANYAGAVFLVACTADGIVGSGALVPRSDGVAEIVRMSVAPAVRRQGIGTRILRELCRRAADAGYRRIVLETTSTWHEVIRFYRRHGFEITHQHEGDTYFSRVVGGPRSA